MKSQNTSRAYDDFLTILYVALRRCSNPSAPVALTEESGGKLTGVSVHMSSDMRAAGGAVFLLAVLLTTFADSQENPQDRIGGESKKITLDDLQGVVIHTKSDYVGRFRNAKGEAPGGFTLRFEIKIGPGSEIEWTITRDVYADTPSGRKTGQLTRSLKSVIGQPTQAGDGSGAGLWLFTGSTLTTLRTFEKGGFKMEIAFKKSASGLQCTVTAPMMQETGAGNTKDQSSMAGGGKVEMLSVRPTGSICSLSERKT